MYGKRGFASHHIAGRGERVVQKAFQRHPTHRPIHIISKAMVIHGEQVTCKGRVSYPDSQASIDAEMSQTHLSMFVSLSFRLITRFQFPTAAPSRPTISGRRPHYPLYKAFGSRHPNSHAIAGGKVLMNNLAFCKVTHSTGHLDSNAYKLLLGKALEMRQGTLL